MAGVRKQTCFLRDELLAEFEAFQIMIPAIQKVKVKAKAK
jgi:hypothetical protein